MSDINTETNDLIDSNTKERLQNTIQATDDELNYLEKLLKIQREKMNNQNGSRSQPSIVIDDFLYHGDLGHAIDLDLLLKLQIGHIINLCDCPLDKEIQDILTVLWIEDLEDNIQGNIRKCFDKTNNFLQICKEKKQKVLVHCQAGISRSSSIVLAYLIKYHNLSLEEAYKHLLDRRPIAAPNHGFLIELIRYEKELRDTSQPKTDDNQPNPEQTIENATDLAQRF